MTDKPFFVTLKNRGLVKISGANAAPFLQNLITNDIHKLQSQPLLYACLLTPQGKFLHDFFITRHGEDYWLDCEGGQRAEDLARRLNIYKLRAAVEISVESDTPVYAILNQPISEAANRDPRHPEMGSRSFAKPEDLPEKPLEDWDSRRIALTIPDGSRDMMPEQSTLLECNLDKLNAIDFGKGCYVGQELTARMHYRGLAKKHLYTVQGENPLIPPNIGELRSRCGDLAIALLKDAEINKLQQSLTILPLP